MVRDSSPVRQRAQEMADERSDGSQSDESDEIDPGSSPAPPGGVAPPDDSDSSEDETDPGSSPAPPGGVAPPDDSDEPDTGDQTSPPGGVAPPDQRGTDSSPDETSGGATDGTPDERETTVPDGLQDREPQTPENVDPERADELRREVVDQGSGYALSDVRVEREGDQIRAFIPEETRRERLRRETASQSSLFDTSDVSIEETDEGLTASIPEPIQREAVREQAAEQTSEYDAEDFSVEQTDEGFRAFIGEETAEQQALEDAAEGTEYEASDLELERPTFDSSPAAGRTPPEGYATVEVSEDYEREQAAEAFASDIAGYDAEDISVERTEDGSFRVEQVAGRDISSATQGTQQQSGELATDVTEYSNESFGQETVSNYDPEAERTSFREAVVSGTTGAAETAYDVTTNPGSAERTLSEWTNVDIDETVGTTGSTLVNRPIDSFVTGVSTIRTGAAATASDAGGASAAGPAIVTGTGATGTTLSTGAVVAGGLVLAPATAAALGARGVQERGDVALPEYTAATATGTTSEVQVPDTAERFPSEIPVDEDTARNASELPVQDRGVESEIEVSEDTRFREPEIEVTEETATFTESEVDAPTGETPTGESAETGAIVDQPSSGFEDLPRDEELGQEESETVTDETPDSVIEDEEDEALEQFRESDYRPLEERQYLQEDVSQSEVSRGEQYVFPGATEPSVSEELFLRSILEADVTEPTIGFGSYGGSELGPLGGAGATGRGRAMSEALGGAGTGTGTGTGTDPLLGIDTATTPQTTVDTDFPQPTRNPEEFDYGNPDGFGEGYEFGMGFDSLFQSRGRGRRLRLPSLDWESGEDEDISSLVGFESETREGEYFDPVTGEWE